MDRASWDCLPAEIREMVMLETYKLLCKGKWNYDDEPPHTYTPLPLVCREFADYFAHINFRVLFLDQHRLREFERTVSGNEMRQPYVERIYLRVRLRLNEFEGEVGDARADRGNKNTFLETVHDFFAIMSRWKRRSLSNNVEAIKIRLSNRFGRIKLHLGTARPSTARELSPISPALAHESDRHDTQGSETENLAASAAAPDSQRTFASAPIFDSLTILWSDPQLLSLGILDQLISEGMPCLKKFQYQSWDMLQIVAEQDHRDECLRVLDVLQRNRVRSLDLFYDSSISFHPDHDTSGPILLGSSFNYAMLATGLRFCCMSSFDDSTTFLGHLGDLYFPQLECLVLKSKFLTGYGFHLDPPDLVKILALAIFDLHNMPKLKILDIWKGGAEHMFLVRIVPVTRKLPGRHVGIVWYSNWLEDDVLVGPFERLLQICLMCQWQPIFWREKNMEPAKDERQPHRANYPGVHRRMIREAKRLS